MQHFRAGGDIFGGDEGFALQRQRDLDKTNLAIASDYRIVRIHCDWIIRSEKWLDRQNDFLRAVLASKDKVVVSSAKHYEWLAECNATPVAIELPK
jgi:hypothetical protein